VFVKEFSGSPWPGTTTIRPPWQQREQSGGFSRRPVLRLSCSAARWWAGHAFKDVLKVFWCNNARLHSTLADVSPL